MIIGESDIIFSFTTDRNPQIVGVQLNRKREADRDLLIVPKGDFGLGDRNHNQRRVIVRAGLDKGGTLLRYKRVDHKREG
jgi:hypothetical protein